MLKYSYTAKDISGKVYKSKLEASDEKDARARLKQRGLFVTKIGVAHERASLNLALFERITGAEIAVFAEQLSVMIDAGLALPRALETIAQQTKNKMLQRVLNEVRQDIINGSTLTDALSKHPKVFSRMFVNLVRAGELGGILTSSLRQISEYLDKEQQTRQKVKAALAYPKVVVVVLILVVVFILIYIVPNFARVYDSLGLKLPLATIILVESSKIIRLYWWGVLGSAVGLVVLYRIFSRSKTGKEILDRIKLYSPVFGNLNKKAAVSRFIRVLSALHSSGVLLMQSLEVAKQAVDNRVMDGIIDNARDVVNKGGQLKEPLSNNDVFPPMVLQMVAVGEETGSLAQSLAKSSDYLDRDIDLSVKQLITKIEPAVTVVVGAVVGLVAMAIYLPMFDIVKITQK